MDPTSDAPGGPAGVAGARGTTPAGAAAEAAEPIASPERIAGDEALAIAASLAAGAVDTAEAARGLIHAAVTAQRPTGLTSAAQAELEREVSALLAGDPTLADLLAPL